MILLRHTDALSVTIRRQAYRLGQKVERRAGDTGSAVEIHGGYICRASKRGSVVTVNIVEPPARFEGSNEYRDFMDPVVGESTINGVISSTAPGNTQMAPASPPVTVVDTEVRQVDLPALIAFGTPLPSTPFLLYTSYSVEFDGGVLYTHFYTDAPPPSGLIITQPVWLVVLVRWAGLGPARSVSFSDAYIQALTGGYDFYPRRLVGGVQPMRYGARLPIPHYSNGRLYMAVEVEKYGGWDSKVGGLLSLCVRYAPLPVVEWSHMVGEDGVDPALRSDVFEFDVGGTYRVAGRDLPAVFSWQTQAGEIITDHCVITSRVRARKAVTVAKGDTYRLATGQIMDTFENGVLVSTTTDYIDAVAGANSVLPIGEVGRVLIQKYRDDLFLSAVGVLTRYRKMRALSRPALENDMGFVTPTVLPIHPDLALLRVESGAGVVQTTQAARGYGPEEQPAGAYDNNGGSSVFAVGFTTPVGVGEVWTWGLINGTSASQIAIARVTASGVMAPIAAGLPVTTYVSTYQREVLDALGAVSTPMAQVVTTLDAGSPKIAVKKGRVGALSFIPAASYSRMGTFFLSTPIAQVKYGRIYG